MSEPATAPNYWALHDEACARGETIYTDPDTGYVVFTRLGLLERGKCCGAGCRHCPFEHASVPMERRAARIQQAAWLSDVRPDPGSEATIMLWSADENGLAHQSLSNPVILIAFDARTRIVANTDIPLTQALTQTAPLAAPVIGVPLHEGADHAEQIAKARDLMTGDAVILAS